ncbi:MurR/RpiR family transcriptional regulator [Companilactobacillus baiquanensis]|uniref:MurR/RpiR family transcriptional regulator n=1 Tax=Companilactobacillus baiquanensis TaxID=2486005 RepID=A0ABW1UXL2_9LACO|nr:MurR/RpiR family transcriptional regulator [Companilactobacillus baiquanensis]
MKSKKNIIDIIYEKLPQMSTTDKKIAQVIIENSEKVVDFTIAQLAHKADVSEASVSRFCKNIDISGFHQLKIKLAQISNQNDGFKSVNGSDLQKSLSNIIDNKSLEIRKTIENLSEEDLKQILKILTDARIIQFTAEGNTYPVVEDAIYKFNQVGILAIGNSSWETSLAQTMNLNNNDVLIVISNSGESKELLEQIKVAHQKNIQVISITNRADSPIAKQSEFHLMTSVRQKVFQSEYYFSRIAAGTLIETIFLLLVSKDKFRRDQIVKHEEIIADRKI